jgi:hypothetical protein
MSGGPELSCGADAGLDFVDDEEDVVSLGEFAEAAEEVGRGVIVAAFGLDGFYDYGDGRGVPFFNQTLGLVETALFFLCVLGGVFFERVFEHGEGSLWPVKCGNVEFVNGF